MQIIKKIPHVVFFVCVLSVFTIMPRAADATVVEIQTVLGSFEVNLTDEATPATVANFLTYVNNADYTNSIFHRSVSDFIVQGGGFVYDGVTPLVAIAANDAVVNEAQFSNLRGTIAMAKSEGDPNSATSQWFISLADNSANLDAQNGGFTVFGQVVGDGMDVVDAIAALSTFGFAAPYNQIPLIDYPATDPVDDLTLLNDSFLVIVNAVVVTDAAVDSGASLDLPINAVIAEQEERLRILRENKASGFGLFSIGLLSIVLLGRRFLLKPV